MRKIKNLVIGGIENKLFNLILMTVILVSAAFLVVSLHQNNSLTDLTAETSEQQQTAMGEITSSLMDSVVEQSLNRTTGLEARIADELFSGLKTRVEMMGQYAARLFSDPGHVHPMPCSPPDPADQGTVTAQLILADGVDAADPALAARLGIAANMSDMMVSLFGASDVTNSCFIALPEGAFLVTDDRAQAKYAEDGTPKSYDPRTRPWYLLAEKADGAVFTDVEIDAFTGDIGIVCAMPVYVNGKLEAVVGSDLFLTSMQAGIQASDENGGYLFIVNSSGHVVFSPKTEGLFRVRQGREAQNLLQSDNAALAALLNEALLQRTAVQRVALEDGNYYINGAPLETVGWALISVFSEAIAKQPVQVLQGSFNDIQQKAITEYREKSGYSRTMIIVLMLIVLALMLTACLLLGKHIVRPLNTMAKRIAELDSDNLEFRMEDSYRTGDEIEMLAESFANLSHQTVAYIGEVERVTAEKERIGAELHMANQIQESMLPSIFPAFPDRPEFDIYATMEPAKEVGGDFYDFFLIDSDHLGMVIADVSGKGVPAALFMMASKIILQSCAMLGTGSPAAILEKTNEAICSNNRMEMFVTVWLGILEISTGRVTAANAGHEYPAMLKDGAFSLLHDKHGFVIGGYDGVRYRDYSLQLRPGDKIFLYTDGIAEATNAQGELYGTDRMLNALNQAPNADPTKILASVRNDVSAFVGAAEQFDDMTMLCVEYKGTNKKEN